MPKYCARCVLRVYTHQQVKMKFVHLPFFTCTSSLVVTAICSFLPLLRILQLVTTLYMSNIKFYSLCCVTFCSVFLKFLHYFGRNVSRYGLLAFFFHCTVNCPMKCQIDTCFDTHLSCSTQNVIVTLKHVCGKHTPMMIPIVYQTPLTYIDLW